MADKELTNAQIDEAACRIGMDKCYYENEPARYWREFAREIVGAHTDLQADSVQADMLKARSILLRWCNDGMNNAQINQLERETLEFCGAKP